MTGSRRAGLAAAALTALAATFLAGLAVGGSTTATPRPRPAPVELEPVDVPLRLANADLTAPGDCQELLASYVARGLDAVGPYGWGGGVVPLYAVDLDAAVRRSVAGSAVEEQGSSETGTNVQEVGVDEPDLAKSDGQLLVRVSDGFLEVYDVTRSQPDQVARVDLPGGGGVRELLLVGDRVVVTTTGEPQLYEPRRETRVTTYDVSDPASPTVTDDRSITADAVSVVQHDDTVRLVLTTGLPDLPFARGRMVWQAPKEATARNREVVRASTIDDWLPQVTTYDADGQVLSTERLVDCDQVVVPSADEAALGTMAVVGFDPAVQDDQDVLGIATDTRLAYFSTDRMYLASSSVSAWGWGWGWPAAREAVTGEWGRSRVYGFDLTDQGVEYAASGVVDGTIEDRWSMDEHDGVLRVAVGPSSETGNYSSVLTLRQTGDRLEEVGRVDRLGVGEEIKAVRWFDDLAIVVTFRQVDPLYAVDLADPDDPRLLGELKIPGFSEYLHPIDGQRLIGMGQDARSDGQVLGAQAALFDLTELTDPQRTDTVAYGRGSVAGAATDPRQFTWLPDQDTALAVVAGSWRAREGWVSVLDVDGARLDDRLVELEPGSDVADVRLVPLPDGRVVLSNGDQVSVFEV